VSGPSARTRPLIEVSPALSFLAQLTFVCEEIPLRRPPNNEARQGRTLAAEGEWPGEAVSVSGETPLLYVLRNDLGLNGPKFGCGLSQCGACAVLMDGVEVRSCVTPVASAVNGELTTSEGLGTPGKLHPIQAAFVAEQAAQCGYCISGMVIAAAALLKGNPSPSVAEIKRGMNGRLCRWRNSLVWASGFPRLPA
jgi:nicotinate dehydrogenase subunit A